MAPTHGRREDIEGRSKYKDYAYSPVPASSSSGVYGSATLAKHPGEILNAIKYRSSHDKYRAIDMTEKGSTFLQYVAAAAGKPFNPRPPPSSASPPFRGVAVGVCVQ